MALALVKCFANKTIKFGFARYSNIKAIISYIQSFIKVNPIIFLLQFTVLRQKARVFVTSTLA